MLRRSVYFLFQDVTIATAKVVNAIPDADWHTEFPDRFGPGDVVAHLIQATRFFSSFVFTAVLPGEPFLLPAPFNAIVEARGEDRHYLISTSNLENARKLRAKYPSERLREMYQSERAKVSETFIRVPEESYEIEISHPLVDWKGPFLNMFLHLFVEHDAEHRGNIGELIKELGGIVPFHSGKIPR